MQDYTKNINYLDSQLTAGESFYVPKTERLQISPEHPSYHDADKVLDHARFKNPYLPLYLGDHTLPNEDIDSLNTNVLRMMIRLDDENSMVHIPKELLALKSFIADNINYHRQFYPVNKNCFIYLTVRQSTYEELFYKEASTWHVDGFQGSRIDRHIVEQDVFWCNKSPTQFLLQPMYCEGLNPSQHDINDFFDRKANPAFIATGKANSAYMATPYNIHRVNPTKFEGKRLFVRINFSPVEIEDNRNTINPMLPQDTYAPRIDVRNFLREYKIDESIDSGFTFESH